MRDEIFVVILLTSEKGDISSVTLIIENGDIGDDLIDAFSG